MTIEEALKSLTAYPIPTSTIKRIAEETGLDPSDSTPGFIGSDKFRIAEAKIYLFLAKAPNVSQNGVSFSFTPEDKKRFITRAASILKDEEQTDEGDNVAGPVFGYKGEDI